MEPAPIDGYSYRLIAVSFDPVMSANVSCQSCLHNKEQEENRDKETLMKLFNDSLKCACASINNVENPHNGPSA